MNDIATSVKGKIILTVVGMVIVGVSGLIAVGAQSILIEKIDANYVRKETFSAHVEAQAKAEKDAKDRIDEWRKIANQNQGDLREIKATLDYLKKMAEKDTQ